MNWCEMRQQRVVDLVAALAQHDDGAVHIDRIPEDDRRRDQIEARGAMALPFEGPVANLAKPVQADRPSQIVAQLAFVQDSAHSAAQLRVKQPVEHEQRSLDAPELAKRERQAILTRVTAQFAQHQRGRHRPVPDGGDQSANLVPVCANMG